MQEGLAKEEIFDSCLEGEQASLRSKNYTRAFQEGREQCTPKSKLPLSKLNQAGLTVPPGKFMHVQIHKPAWEDKDSLPDQILTRLLQILFSMRPQPWPKKTHRLSTKMILPIPDPYPIHIKRLKH